MGFAGVSVEVVGHVTVGHSHAEVLAVVHSGQVIGHEVEAAEGVVGQSHVGVLAVVNSGQVTDGHEVETVDGVVGQSHVEGLTVVNSGQIVGFEVETTVDDGVSVEAEEELKVVPVGQVGHSVGHVWHSVGHVGHSVGQTVTVSLGYAGQLQLVVPSVVVDITGAVVDVMIVELLGDVDEVVLAYRVVWAASVVDEQTGQFVVLIIGQSVVGSNVGHDVAASVVGFVVTVGQGVQVGTVGVVHGIAVVVVVGLAVLVVKQGGQVGAVVGVGVVTMICGSSTARTTVSYRVSSSICVALMTT